MPAEDDGEPPVLLGGAETPVDAVEPDVPDPLAVPEPIETDSLDVPDPLRLGITEGSVPDDPTTLLAIDCPRLVPAETIDGAEEPRDTGAPERLGTGVALGAFVFDRIPEGPKMIPVLVATVVSVVVAEEADAAGALGDNMVNGSTLPDPVD